jgi:uncharacterized membrane protein
MTVGPIQFVAFGVRTEEHQNELARNLRTLSEKGVIRVIDLFYAKKKEDGTVTQGRMSGLTEDEQKRYGTIAGSLIGLGYGAIEGAARAGVEFGAYTFAEKNYGVSVQELKDQVNDLIHDLPTNAAFCIALIEHRWATTLKENLQKAGVVILAQGMVRPSSLVMLGAELAAAEQAAMH